MFNNPFDSFHNMVAEAKEEREQLDRLLTISTPRERLLVGVIGLLLAILVGWLFFGNMARTVTLEGVLAGPGENAVDVDRSVEALVWVESGIATRIEPGMAAVLELARADGEAEQLDGKIASVGAVGSPERDPAFESAAPVSPHRVYITLDESLDFARLANRECRIRIELGRQPPAALFGMRRS